MKLTYNKEDKIKNIKLMGTVFCPKKSEDWEEFADDIVKTEDVNFYLKKELKNQRRRTLISW